MGFDTIIYRDTSCDITPDPSNAPGNNNSNQNRPPCCGLGFALAPCLRPPVTCLVSRLAFFVVFLPPIRWTHHGTDRTTSKHHSWFGLLHECIIVFVASFCFLSFPVSFPFLLYISNSVIEISQTFFGVTSISTENKKYRMIYREILIRYRIVVSNPQVFFLSYASVSFIACPFLYLSLRK